MYTPREAETLFLNKAEKLPGHLIFVFTVHVYKLWSHKKLDIWDDILYVHLSVLSLYHQSLLWNNKGIAEKCEKFSLLSIEGK